VDEGDQPISDLVYPHAMVETTLGYLNPSQRWWFLDEQMKNEVLLMQAFDSESRTRMAQSKVHDNTC
jgi:hypothetical protein